MFDAVFLFYQPGVGVLANLLLERAAGDTDRTIEQAQSARPASQIQRVISKRALTGPIFIVTGCHWIE